MSIRRVIWMWASVFALCGQFVTGLVSTSQPVAAQTAQPTPVQLADIDPGRLIVVLKPTSLSGGTTNVMSTAASYAARPGVTVSHRYTRLVKGFAGNFDQAAIKVLVADPNVAAIYPDMPFYPHAQEMPTGTDRIDADLNPTKAGNGSGSVPADVAIFDSGIRKHDDLNVVGGIDCAMNASPYSDQRGHGTAVAGVVGAKDNGFGTVGAAPGARLWAIKIANDEDGLAYASFVSCGQNLIASKPEIKIINFSYGGPDGGYKETCSSGLTRQGFCELKALGVVTIVSAGNDYVDASNWAPAQWPEVITVSAYDDQDGKPGGLDPDSLGSDDTFAYFSNYGKVVDIAAPGVNIRTTSAFGDNGYESAFGTSFAAPYVAGAAALLLAQQGISGKDSVIKRLLLTAEPGAIPGDPDAYKEPLLNVAALGVGKLTAPSSAKPGDVITIGMSGFAPECRVILRFDGTYIGGVTVNDQGTASRLYTIPASKRGPHQFTASVSPNTITRTITVNPALFASPGTAYVDNAMKVTLKGYGGKESVKITFDGRTMGTVVTSSSGTATLTFAVPATAYGSKIVRGTGNQGSSASKTISLRASAVLTNAPVGPATPAKITLRGFGAGEAITFRWDATNGEALGTKTMSSTGSGSATVPLPDAPAGSHSIFAVGDQGHTVKVDLGVTSAEEPTVTPSATSTATAIPPATATPVVEKPSSTATEPLVETPTETAIPVESIEPTATPEIPTGTATIEPVPTETDTP